MRSPPGKERALDRSSRSLTPPSRALPARSYNVAHYYANRNFTGETSTSTLAKSYAAAVTFSIGSALAIERAARGSAFQRQLRYAGPLAAVSAATFVNMGMMRQSELLEGVVVKDELGDDVSTFAKDWLGVARGNIARTIEHRQFLMDWLAVARENIDRTKRRNRRGADAASDASSCTHEA